MAREVGRLTREVGRLAREVGRLARRVGLLTRRCWLDNVDERSLAWVTASRVNPTEEIISDKSYDKSMLMFITIQGYI